MSIMEFPICIKTTPPENRGSCEKYRFEIIESNQEKALRELLNWLTHDIEIFLSDHRRGDPEGGVIVQIRNEQLQYMRGGHGYSSDWFSSSQNEVLNEMLETVRATRWGALLGNGTIAIYKKHLTNQRRPIKNPRAAF